ncbi:MAG: hypothetical protein ABIZ70_03855 [Gemmatimonadales bacterium]
MRVLRGMLGTGLTFAVGVGGFSALVGIVLLIARMVSLVEILQMAGRLTVISFILGVVFSGVLALSAGGRSFGKLSLGFVTALGAGGGLIYWLLIGFAKGFRAWTLSVALANLSLLLAMGSGAAAATFLLARRAGKSLRAGDEVESLGEGSLEATLAERERERASQR